MYRVYRKAPQTTRPCIIIHTYKNETETIVHNENGINYRWRSKIFGRKSDTPIIKRPARFLACTVQIFAVYAVCTQYNTSRWLLKYCRLPRWIFGVLVNFAESTPERLREVESVGDVRFSHHNLGGWRDAQNTFRLLVNQLLTPASSQLAYYQPSLG